MKITINPKFNLGDKVWVSDRISKYTSCPTCKGKGDIKVEYKDRKVTMECPDCFGSGDLDCFQVPTIIEINRISFDKKLRFNYRGIGYMNGGEIDEKDIFLTKEEAMIQAEIKNKNNWSIHIPEGIKLEDYIRGEED